MNLASRTAVVSPNDLRKVADPEPALVTVRGVLTETPSLRVYGPGDRESFRTLARIQVTAFARNGKWQPADGPVMVSTKGELPVEFFGGREVEIAGVLARPLLPLAPGLFDYRTHGDLKHIGGAELLMAEFKCRDIYASSFRFRSGAYRPIFALTQREPYHFRTLHWADQVGPWHILHPTESDEFTQADDGALVRRAEFFGVPILLLSNLGRAGQDRLLERSPELRADIVVTGIPAQTEPLNDALLDAIRPRLIIIADSELPATARASERLKERLARRNTTVIYTRETGAVTISFRANECEIKTAGNLHFKLKELPEMNRAMPLPPSEPGEE